MLKLQFKDQRKPAIWLVDARYAIGKDTQNNIVLTDDGVSPFHAEIRVEADQVFISDTGSTNGTFVNGKRIQRRTELRSSDVISIHTVQLMLVDPKQEHSAPVAEGATAITPALANIPIAGGPAAKATAVWSLKAKTGSLVGKTFPIPPAGKVIIGRANNCDIQLPANHVSRQHAEVQIVSGKLMVKDLNSSNGTYINRKKVADGELKNGDEVRFDTFSFEVVGPGAGAAAAAAAPEQDAANTQYRPAVAETGTRPKADLPEAAAKPAGSNTKPPSATAATRVLPKVSDPAPEQPAAPEAAGGGRSNTKIVIAAVIVVAAAAAWFLLS